MSSDFRTESDAPAYLSIRLLARYSGLSVRTLRKHLSDPIHPIPHYRVGGQILVSRREFDAWMVAFRETRGSVDWLLADVLKGSKMARADMGVQVRFRNGAWWLVIDHRGSRRSKKIGERETAIKIAKLTREALAAGDLRCTLRTDGQAVDSYAGEWIRTLT